VNAEAQRTIGQEVRDGKLSREDAEKKLIEIRRAVFGQPGDQGRRR